MQAYGEASVVSNFKSIPDCLQTPVSQHAIEKHVRNGLLVKYYFLK